MGINKSEEYLDYLIKIMGDFTYENYGVVLDIPVVLSKKMKSNFGTFVYEKKCVMNKGKIEEIYPKEGMIIKLSKELLNAKSEEIVEKIAKHEALHYTLCVLGLPFGDGDKTFEDEIKKHDLVGTNVGTENVLDRIIRWVWVCEECGKIAKVNHSKTRKNYRNGYYTKCCNGKLSEKGWMDLDVDQFL